MNKKKFLINESVYFYPAKQLLESASKDKESVSLNVPASRCLTLLLEKKGEIVTKYDFSQEVWENRGQYTSANTLYQNISLIRKALRSAGISQDVIHTVPREGFSFLGTVASLEEEEIVTGNHVDSESVEKEAKAPETSIIYNNDVINYIYSTQGTYSQKIDKNMANSYSAKEQDNTTPWTISLKFIDRIYQYKWRAISVALLLALLFHTPYYYSFKKNDSNFFSNYQKIGVINQCTLMKSSNDKLRQKEEYLSIFKEKNIQCGSKKNVYIAMDTRATKIFMHICDQNTDDTSSCFSTFFIEH